MANVNAPMGLRTIRHYMGGLVRLNEYQIASALGSNIFDGDLVKSTGTTKQITVCAAGDRSVGVFRGVRYQETDGNYVFRRYWPSGTTLLTGSTCYALVNDDPHTLFAIQCSAGFAVTDVGSVTDITAATAGSTATGQSGMQADSTLFSASGSAQLKIIELVNSPDNAYGTNAKVAVLINEHELNAAMTAV